VHLIQLINAFFSLFFLFLFEEDILQNFVHFFFIKNNLNL